MHKPVDNALFYRYIQAQVLFLVFSKEGGFGYEKPIFLFLQSVFSQEMDPMVFDVGNPVLTDIWVDPAHGSDGRSGFSSDQALLTLSEAWNRIPRNTVLSSTGYRIRLKKGNYLQENVPSYWESRYGSPVCPILIQSEDSADPVELPALNLFDCRCIYLVNLHFSGGGGDVLHFEKCDSILVQRCVVQGLGDLDSYDCPQEAIKANQCQYLYIEDSDISGAWGNALDFVAVQYGHIVRNKIHRALDWCLYVKGGSACIRIEANEIYDGGTGGFSAGQGTGFEFMVSPWLHYEAYDIKFINNIIHNTDGAGMGVNGGYNILMAYNTLYQVGERSHVVEAAFGLRGCDGNESRCRNYLAQGGWGTAVQGAQEPIPNRNVFIYNNLVYNPSGYRSAWSHVAVLGERNASSGTNIPSPVRTDVNLQIRGNWMWNGPADLPLGVEESDQGCRPDNSTCNEDQLRQDNSINQTVPPLKRPENGDFHPVSGGDVPTVKTVSIPDFLGGDCPAPPEVPQGNLSNQVLSDFDGNPRMANGLPGAFAASRSFYVSPDGDNANPGSREKPWAAPGYASRQLSPGDTLVILGGRYRLSRFDEDILIPKSGTSAGWITIRGEPGNRPVLAGADNLFAAVIFDSVHFIRLENLEITHDDQASGPGRFFRDGITIAGDAPSTHIVLKDLYIHHLDEFGLNVQDADSMEITDCRIEYCGFGAVGGPAAKHGGWKHVRIERCRLSYSGHYYQGGDGAGCPYDGPDGFGIEPSDGPIDIVNTVAEHNVRDGLDSKASHTSIRQCVVANNSCDGVKLWGGESLIENTLIYGRGDGNPTHTPWAAIVIGTEQANSNFAITNVTVDDSLGNNYLMHVQYDEPQTPIRLTIRNSIFRGTGPRCAIFIRDVVQLTCENNLFFLPQCGSVLVYGNTEYGSSDMGNFGKGNLYGDPTFVRPAWGKDGDYHLKPGSPALDAGNLQFATTTDLDGTGRPQGNAPDMGCYEAVPTAVKFSIRNEVAAAFSLMQNYPNPANPTTVFEFQVPEKSRFQIQILDLHGKSVRVFKGNSAGSEWHSIRMDFSDLASGIYFYRLAAGKYWDVKKMIVLH